MKRLLIGAERLRNSRSGNPCWRLQFLNGYATTAPDVADANEVPNLLGHIERTGGPIAVTVFFEGQFVTRIRRVT